MLAEAWEYLTTADNWWGRSGLVRLTWNHLRLSGAVLIAALAVTLPPALWLGHLRKGRLLAVGAVNLSRALPTFAVLAFVFPFSLRYGFGLGFWPTFVPLLLLALPPIFVNTFTGVSEIDPTVVEAAHAMGMKDREVLLRVEMPAALPLIVAGIRVAAVQVVATTTLGALVGYRCLGTPILAGIAANRKGQLLVAATLVALLSIATEVAFGVVARRLAPWTRTDAAHRHGDPVTEAVAGNPGY